MSAEQNPTYGRIVSALEDGRRALVRARFTAGLLRFLGIALVTVAAVIVWALLQRALRINSVPVAAASSLAAVGVVVFALVRWVVVPMIRLPGRQEFVDLVEKRFPQEKNLIVNAYQLGGEGKAFPRSGDLIDALVERAASRVQSLDLRRWRDPAPDRPYLWAGASAVVVVAALGLLTPALLGGAVGQVLRPSLAQAPPVFLEVTPGDIEVERGADVAIGLTVTGTGEVPVLRFRERSGDWRVRDFSPRTPTSVTRDGGDWSAVLAQVDRNLEYQVSASRAESGPFSIRVKEPPRINGFRALMTYPAYTGMPPETVESSTGDIAALKGTEVDLRILVNRELSGGYAEWRADGAGSQERRPLRRVDEGSWSLPVSTMEPAEYSVVFTDADGSETVHTPVYRIEPAPDRAPFLTLHLPKENHDLYQDMMEKVVADAADDYGFSSVRIVHRVDDGPEKSTAFRPFTEGQHEFRLDTLWDMSALSLVPGSTVTFYVEVKDNDTVSGPKAARSDAIQVRFPTVAEMFAEVAEEHDNEIDNLAGVQDEQETLRQKLEQLTQDLKAGKDMDWDAQHDLEKGLEHQAALEQQVSNVLDQLQETTSKASDRASMNQQLVQKMSQLNDLLSNVANEDLQRAFQRLSDALKSMDRNEIRDALEDFQKSQDQMLQGLDRTIDLLKQIRMEEQVEDVVRRAGEIAEKQQGLTQDLKEMGVQEPPAAPPADETQPADEKAEGKNAEGDKAQEGDKAAKGDESQKGDKAQDGDKSQDGDKADQDAKAQEGDQAQKGDESQKGDKAGENGEQPGDKAEQEQKQGDQNGAKAGDENQKEGNQGESLPMTPEMQKLLEEAAQLQQQIAEEQLKRDQGANAAKQEQLTEQLKDALRKLQDAQKAQEQLAQNQEQGKQSQSGQQQSTSGQQKQQSGQQQSSQQGQQNEQQQGQKQQGQQQQNQQEGGKPSTPEEKERLQRLAEQQEEVQKLVEELKRQLEMLRKLNTEDQNLAKDLEEMQQGETTESMQQNMQQAGSQMQGGKKQESAKYAFKARDEANRLAQMAQNMQSDMQSRMEDDSIERMGRIIQGLIDVSGVEQGISEEPSTDDRELAARQFALVERAQAWAESLQALASQSFSVDQSQGGQLRGAVSRMERSTRFFELGNLRSAQHEGKESSSDLNETIVQLMKSHNQMCSRGGGGGQMQQLMQRMQGLSEGQQQINDQTRSMADGGGQRLNMTQQERLKWLSAQQEMIRQGLEEARHDFGQAKDLLGDMDALDKDMAEAGEMLQKQQIDRQLFERQQQILSRLLDAQRSVRQQEMSPERESKTGTLAQRESPPDIPADLTRSDRTLEEDVLRGANDRYPVQYRRLVEDYFRALAKESRNP